MWPIMCCTWPTIYVSIRWSFASIGVQYLMQVVNKLYFSIHVYFEPILCIDRVSSYLFHHLHLCLLCRVPIFFGVPSTYKKKNHAINLQIYFFSIKLLLGLLDMHKLSQKIFLNLSTLDAEYIFKGAHF